MENDVLRLVIFVGVLVLMMMLEALFPRKSRQQTRSKRWASNLSLVVINSLTLKLLGPISAVAAASYAFDNNWGLLTFLPAQLPFFLEVIVGVVFLDFSVYIQHVASHKIPLLWRLHKVHHADRDIDVTTGVRFHPLEAMLSMVYKCGVVLLLGPLALAVVIFEVLLNASAMFNHANLRLPKLMDSILRKVIVTPDFHRVHHSVYVEETDSNYGFFLSIWDRLCGTHTAQPREGHQEMSIGLKRYQTAEPAKLSWCLITPFKKRNKQMD
ncbi:sterol desaturase family protein [Marinomonas sp. C2222]|uniref:Sterol desaturase family protein n=1 Tax=Marinomonas sargassi TaxID=2984494 RepID=A0ABT2YR97_9GAMM|nr:sterol desaturase family protein [Marinomonas sargassi]MCV2402414.1 sterol desaturase family protein [Marinomonas sargassi]